MDRIIEGNECSKLNYSLLGKCKALSSNPSTAKTTKRNKKALGFLSRWTSHSMQAAKIEFWGCLCEKARKATGNQHLYMYPHFTNMFVLLIVNCLRSKVK
jgi:hypothetical protein